MSKVELDDTQKEVLSCYVQDKFIMHEQIALKMYYSTSSISSILCKHPQYETQLQFFTLIGWIKTSPFTLNIQLNPSHLSVLNVVQKHPEWNNTQIADSLNIQTNTVYRYFSYIREYLNIGNPTKGRDQLRLCLYDYFGWYNPFKFWSE